ncbi:MULTISPECIES: hypothetical protein [Ramlibacter]|uniref:Uncharacterized protein n=1 Tax=Ramlibacter pinisoli TaxID=2682844 RepID=A0A6N8IVG3_9BURK|nr:MULTISPECIES: hypothetical protein [Ramlibacter]MBA2960988.1 hypothetical protein [Ramlibacter sp. CGMCC 1.13660]MVQ30934.1 hypothetical protein [Ramlibacter pinisoli]
MTEPGARRHTVGWPEAVAHFEALARDPVFEPLAALVASLASSRYAASLHPCAEDELLVLGRRPQFEAGRDELQVRFEPQHQQFVFAHVQRPGEAEPWSRACDAGEGRAVLERLFHRRLHWFHEG